MAPNPEWSFETKQIHAGQIPDPVTGARALPIYQSTAYVFPSSEVAAARFQLKELGPIYGRIDNPTNEVVENRIAALEGGVGALLVASGMGATTLAVLNVASAGNNIVASPSLYGGTTNLFSVTLPKYGVEVRYCADPADPQSWIDAADDKTVAFFGETIPNPKCDILDIAMVAEAAHRVGVPLIVDNTVPTPYLTRPFEWGADIIVHSATKYLGGHGTAMAGAIVDSGNFDFSADPKRFPGFNEPDASYNGVVYARDFGAEGALGANVAFIIKCRVQGQRDFGFAASPFHAFLVALGIETLSLRMERHVDNAFEVANYLATHPQVLSVNYPGLPSSPYYSLAQKYCPRGAGACFAFDLAGGLPAGRAFVEALQLHSHLTNLGDVRSIVTHPASTTHSQSSPAALASSGVTPGTIRLAVGLENIADIIADLEIGFTAARAALASNEAS